MKYKSITKINKILKILKHSIDDESEILVWSNVENEKIAFSAVMTNYDPAKEEILIVSSKELSKEKVKNFSKENEQLVFAHIDNQSIIFKSKLEFKGKFVLLSLPSEIKIIDRRANPRIECKATSMYKLSFKIYDKIQRIDVKTMKNLYDLSRGGCSIVVGEEEGRSFKEGFIINEAKLSIEEFEFEIDLKIIKVKKVTPKVWNELAKNKFKIGFSFENFNEKDIKKIELYILNYFSKLEKESNQKRI